MKKFALIALILVGCITSTFAQDDIILHITDYPNDVMLCLSDNQRVIIYAEDGYENCPDFAWYVNGSYNGNNPLIINPLSGIANIRYNGCSLPFYTFYIQYFDAPIPNCFTHTVWKRQNQPYTLEAIGADSVYYPNQYGFIWNTGETTRTIDVTEPGTYTCESVGRICGDFTRTFIVRDNVELYRATVDLTSNLNQTTWQTTPEQAEYISAVKVYRNGTQLVATVPYADGVFTDDIGSEATQWQYHLVGVDTDGNDCPIPSYWKRTIHLDHVQGTQGQHILQWTPYEEETPTKETVVAYGIYDIINGIANHIIDVGNFTNVYTYNPADFEGYGAVAAVFAEKRGLEEYAFSNMTDDILDVAENTTKQMSIFPNPSHDGTISVRYDGKVTVFNVFGQLIATGESSNGVYTVSNLSPGTYFVKSDEGVVRKVIVE